MIGLDVRQRATRLARGSIRRYERIRLRGLVRDADRSRSLGILLALILVFRPKGLVGGHEVELFRPSAASSPLRA